MSGRLVGEVLKCAPVDLTPAQRLVLVALAEDARDRDRLARFSSVAVLSHHTCLAPGSVKNILKHLTDRGLIKPLHRGQLGTIQHYRITELYDHHRDAVATPKGDTA
ncbi:MAG: hypothetical protein SHS37scaffold537_45 [Phage 68_12]|nr:MAG: hypothetical protein SHS37scaffold537_45 [Phage 68_12]